MIANRVRMRKKPKGDTWDGVFADPEAGRRLHVNGLIADANKSSIKELATITSLNPSGSSNGSCFHRAVITQFPELQYCTGVTDLTYAFAECRKLTTAPVILESVTNMKNTFTNCESLKKAPIIPSGVTNMYGTFMFCSDIDGIYIINAVTPPICSYTFYSTSVQAIYVPSASVSKYKSATGWREFSSKIYSI